MKRFKVLGYIIALLIPYILIYKAFFLPGLLSFGDAPYFYPENLKELFHLPLLWDFRNNNFGADQSYISWLYLPTFLYGLFYKLFGFTNDILIRLIFYFPATILSLMGSWIFISRFTKNTSAKILASCLYGFNTYFLLLLDGGQVGVALAYGLFPIVLFAFYRFLEQGNFKNYLLALIPFFILANVDIRVTILAVLFIILETLIRKLFSTNSIKKSAVSLILIFIALIPLNFFWLFPLIINNQTLSTANLSTDTKGVITWLDSFLLYQPQFPLNEFGKVFQAPLYFIFLPAILFLGLIIKKGKVKYSIFFILFLIFIFLTKGSNEPFGQVYNWVFGSSLLGIAFRDSSKFFIPSILSASVLLALFSNILKENLSLKKYYFCVGIIYFYIFLLIYPAVLGNLSGALKTKQVSSNFSIIYEELKNQEGSFRTLWFDERPPLGFQAWEKPSISANTLYQEYPFASMIVGNYDLYYFLNSELLPDWLKLLNIKYVFFPVNERKKTWTVQEQKDREEFVKFTEQISGFKKLDWPINFPGYQVNETKEKIFTVDKVAIVLGGTDIYKTLKEEYNLDLSSKGFVFFEDGMLNPETLYNLPPGSAFIVVQNNDMDSLSMSFLQDSFLDLFDSSGRWGIYKDSDYLKWKNELLKNGVFNFDLGFKKEVAFSTITNEQLVLDVDIKKEDKYYLSLRHINASESGALKVVFGSSEAVLEPSKEQGFRWDIIGPFNLDKGPEKITFQNLGGFQALNTVAVIKESDLEEAKQKVDRLTGKFPVFNLTDEAQLKSLGYELSNTSKAKLNFSQVNPALYKINIDSPSWIVFSDHYNPDWKLNNVSPYPLYSMINGFWVDDQGDVSLEYTPQKNVPFALALSLMSAIVVLAVFCFNKFKKHER